MEKEEECIQAGTQLSKEAGKEERQRYKMATARMQRRIRELGGVLTSIADQVIENAMSTQNYESTEAQIQLLNCMRADHRKRVKAVARRRRINLSDARVEDYLKKIYIPGISVGEQMFDICRDRANYRRSQLRLLRDHFPQVDAYFSAENLEEPKQRRFNEFAIGYILGRT